MRPPSPAKNFPTSLAAHRKSENPRRAVDSSPIRAPAGHANDSVMRLGIYSVPQGDGSMKKMSAAYGVKYLDASSASATAGRRVTMMRIDTIQPKENRE